MLLSFHNAHRPADLLCLYNSSLKENKTSGHNQHKVATDHSYSLLFRVWLAGENICQTDADPQL